MDVLVTGVNLQRERKDDGMAWEFAVLDFIQENMRNGILDTIMPMITSLGNGGIVWILLAVCADQPNVPQDGCGPAGSDPD